MATGGKYLVDTSVLIALFRKNEDAFNNTEHFYSFFESIKN